MTARKRRLWTLLVGLAALAAAAFAWQSAAVDDEPGPSREAGTTVAAGSAEGPAPAADSAQRPALTVTTTRPEKAVWPRTLPANGSVAPWQEIVVGSEVSGLRLAEVLVNVGDRVEAGQLLARLSSETIEAERAQIRAALAEAEATLAEAQANAERARKLEKSGAMSAQQIAQYEFAERTARARVRAQGARLQAEELRLGYARIVAPDAGVVSSRTATMGSIVQPGAELFRLIRQGRLEWRAEVTAVELSRVEPGMSVRLTNPDGTTTEGRVRIVAPTVDPQTRNALVYVDLPPESPARAGMFARGEIELGRAPALTLPQSAVLLREGFSYVFRIGDDRRVAQTKVGTGRRHGDRIEVLDGLAPDATVVAGGVGFLADGDLVRVVEAAP